MSDRRNARARATPKSASTPRAGRGSKATSAKAPRAGKSRAAQPKPAARKAKPAAGFTATPPSATSRKASPRKPAAARRPSRAPKPRGLEVLYSGKLFRSRLEARWAILFDQLGIDWDYEPCHYRVGADLWYLPDFYLPGHRLWVEVKGATFLDAESMAKCLAAVAGPTPISQREAPHDPADRLLLVSAIDRDRLGRPVHTMITPDAPGRAALMYATFGPEGAIPVGEPFDVVPATGIKATRRPSPARTAVLLDPAPAPGTVPSELASAYRFAATVTFDETTRQVSSRNDPAILTRLARRRAGRPLGAAA
ncbi:hypothetical protein V6N00_13255 [Tersicoccus sp. MR15.9]|uniref:hypothetical protein n=1 Tax=Tersicoccus mangrovi TaxID=3121635 RepID=UPI002FE570E5